MTPLRDRLLRAARFSSAIRRYFASQGYAEVDTPCLAPSLIPEAAIEVFRTDYRAGTGAPLPLYLAPSPELWMKRLLARGSGNIFQIARSFRNGDYGPRTHNPEFRLLEWYATEAAYTDCIPVTEGLLAFLQDDAEASRDPAVSPPLRRMTMEEAFRELAGIDLPRCAETGRLVSEGERIGLVMPPEPTWEEAFHVIFLSRVETELPQDRPLVLMDYPAAIPTTARAARGSRTCERWELYIRGVEIANCYTEETDPVRIQEFLRGEQERKAEAALVPHPTDEGFGALFQQGFPPSAGVALGVDRLEMVMRGETSLEGVILFPFSAIVPGKPATFGEEMRGKT
jgi:elongation factor P--(R)-beta-lysine ligase